MRKFILMFIICVSSFMIYTNNVKAYGNQSISMSSVNEINLTQSNGYLLYNWNIADFTSNYDGKLFFNIGFKGSTLMLKQVYIRMNESPNYSVCDISNVNTYLDSGTQLQVLTIVCPMQKGRTYYDIQLDTIKFNNGSLYVGKYGSIIEDYYGGSGTSSDYSSTLNTINNNITNIAGIMSEWRWSVGAIHSDLQDILTQINNYNTSISNKLNDINANASSISSNTNDIKDSINDSSIDNNNATGTINNLSGQLASDNTITSLLLLPINFINVLIDGLSGECVPYSLGDLWGSEIVLPCVNLYSTFGAIWYMVDTGLSALVIFKMSKYFIRLFNKLTNLKDGGLEEAYS